MKKNGAEAKNGAAGSVKNGVKPVAGGDVEKQGAVGGGIKSSTRNDAGNQKVVDVAEKHKRVVKGPGRAWYVLYTSPRSEKKAEVRLKNAGVETFLPLHKVKRRWSDRVKVVEQPLFSSYIFVNCDDYKLRQLPLIYGVSRIVYYNGRPALVRKREIVAIREFLDIAMHKEIISNGDEVEILCGPLRSCSGKVIEVNDKYAKLTIEEMGAKICVSLLDLNKKFDEK